MAAAKGRIVLVLDALNQLEDRDGAPDLVWLPPVMPENVRLIVSTLPGRPLDEIKKRHWPTLEVGPLSQAERKRLIGEYLAQYAKALSPARVQRIAATPQSANPLYLRVLLDELRLFGDQERLEQRIGYYLQAESPRDLYRKVIARWEQDYGKGTPLVGNTLALLWAARRGLSETERLHALSKDGQPLARATWSPLLLAMSDALVSRSGLLSFAHDFLRRAAQDAYLATEQHQRQAHLYLAKYFTRQPRSPRQMDELPWQLARAGAWKPLASLLSDDEFLPSLWRHSATDLFRYWAQIEAHGTVRLPDALRGIIGRPEDHLGAVKAAHAVLHHFGHLETTTELQQKLIAFHRKAGHRVELARALGLYAESCHCVGRSEEAVQALTSKGRSISRKRISVVSWTAWAGLA